MRLSPPEPKAPPVVPAILVCACHPDRKRLGWFNAGCQQHGLVTWWPRQKHDTVMSRVVSM